MSVEKKSIRYKKFGEASKGSDGNTSENIFQTAFEKQL
jgi:hypothetical protein